MLVPQDHRELVVVRVRQVALVLRVLRAIEDPLGSLVYLV